MDQDHFIKEFQQIALVQKKIDATIAESISRNEQISQIISHMEDANGFASSVIDDIASNKIVLTENSLTIINHELRTPLVPITSYADLLLQGKFGPLTEQQREKIEIIGQSAWKLKQKIDLLLDRRILSTDVPNTNKSGHKVNELEQQNALLEKINQLLASKISEDESEIKKIKDDLKQSEHSRNEFAQTSSLLNKAIQVEEQKNLHLGRKNILIIAVAAIILCVGFASYSLYVVNLVGSQYQVSNLGKINSGGYLIQNLRGDIIDTWLSWRLVQGSAIHVGIMNGASYPEKIPLIKEVVESEESIEVDDSLLHKGPKGSTSMYYVGWQGALKKAATQPTQFYIPTKLEVVDSPRGEGEITVILTDDKSGDGYSGYTKSIADDSQNQILKSTITIYDVKNLNDQQFEAILRHEFGHALGLGHSTAPEELMAPTIITFYPYISDCDINTLADLYDGSKNSQVVCEK